MQDEIRQIGIKHIRLDDDTQARAGVDDDVVLEYAAAIESGTTYPPVTLFQKIPGTSYWIGDGHHRVRAYAKAGQTNVPAIVKTGDRRDAILHACGANAEHGLRRTNADKHRAVGIMLGDEEWSKLPDSEISRRCSVSQQFVSKCRASYNSCKMRICDFCADAHPANPAGAQITEVGGSDQKVEVRDCTVTAASPAKTDPSTHRIVTRGGKTYEMNVSAIGKTADAAPPADAPDSDTEPTDAPPWAEFNGKVTEIISEIRRSSRKLDALLDFHPNFKRSQVKWGHWMTPDGTTGMLNAVVRYLENKVPAELIDKAPGFIPVDQFKAKKSLAGGSR